MASDPDKGSAETLTAEPSASAQTSETPEVTASAEEGDGRSPFETLAAHSSDLVYSNTVPSLRAADVAAAADAADGAAPAVGVASAPPQPSHHTEVLHPPKPHAAQPSDGDSGLFGGFASAPAEALRPRVSRVPTQRSKKNAAPESIRGADRTDPLLGRCLAEKYTLTKLLGQGAMGQVYRGVHETLGLPIAVKVMRRSVAGDPVYRRRFSREARAASMLAHPNVVRVLDYGEDSGMPFIVMEFVEGQDLDAWITSSVSLPSLKLVGFIGDQVLSALQAAHELGIVHRDLKPENVMLCRGAAAPGQEIDLCAKVSDFGLAHVEDPRDNLPTLTQRDAVAGTPSFMSPEQCRSLAVGPSTDLYAFGCLLTCMLQGDPPFDGSSPIDVISKQMFAEPPPLERPEGLEPVPPLLERLRLELLAKKAHKRPATAADTRRRLREALNADTNRELVPDRKGEIPLGARSERAGLAPSGSTAASSAAGAAAEQDELSVAWVQLPQGSGCDEALRMGLNAQAVRVGATPAEHSAAQLVLLDASQATQAVEWLAQHPLTLPVVVSLPTVDTQGINALIAAGAREVVTQPLESGSLARRLRRAVRRARR